MTLWKSFLPQMKTANRLGWSSISSTSVLPSWFAYSPDDWPYLNDRRGGNDLRWLLLWWLSSPTACGQLRLCWWGRRMAAVVFVWTIAVSMPSPKRTLTHSLRRCSRLGCWSKLFSSLDLHRSYWQVELAPDARPKTAITIRQFHVMPFGLCIAPATFEWLRERVLEDVPSSHCIVYLDNLLVHANDFDSSWLLQSNVPPADKGDWVPEPCG